MAGRVAQTRRDPKSVPFFFKARPEVATSRRFSVRRFRRQCAVLLSGRNHESGFVADSSLAHCNIKIKIEEKRDKTKIKTKKL